MIDHSERIATARSAVDYITGQPADLHERPVPNCPGWTAYNAATHIGRVAIAWEEMITAQPDDPESRERGYARSGQKPTGASMVALWAWHAASELGVHRLDVEAALGHDRSLTDAQALDAATYTCQFFLPAMRRATEQDPGRLTVRLVGAGGMVSDATIDNDQSWHRRSR